MDKVLITQALKNIAQSRIKAEKDALYRRSKALMFDDVARAYEKLTDEILRVSKCEGRGEKVGKDNIESLQQAFEKTLKKHGIESFEPNYSCKKCSDTGIANGQMCECLKREVAKILAQSSGFAFKSFKDARFDIFKDGETTKKIYAKMQEWCHQSVHTKDLIYIYGKTGVGKTYLIQCMAKELCDEGNLTKFVSAFELNQALIDSRYNYRANLCAYTDVAYLFIDDLGSEGEVANVTDSGILSIISVRKQKNLPTIITSNLDLQGLISRYGERLYSRIVDRQTSINIFMDGEDLRTRHLKK